MLKEDPDFAAQLECMVKDNPDFAKTLTQGISKEILPSPVSVDDWRHTHPLNMSCGSDKFYTDLANRIFRTFANLMLPPDLPSGFYIEVAMVAAKYLEDFVSDTGVWRAMRALYRERFGKWLPFFDTDHDDYYEDDLNIEDIMYLVWQAMMRTGQADGRIFSPLSPAVKEIATLVYDVILDCADKAPAATRVTDHMRKEFKAGSYVAMRYLALWLVMDNSITATFRKREELLDGVETWIYERPDLQPQQATYCLQASLAWDPAIGMTGDGSHTLLASLARVHGYDHTASLLDTVKRLSMTAYAVERYDSSTVTLKNAMGEEYVVDINSFAKGTNWQGIRQVACEIVKYGELWHQNGLAICNGEAPDWNNGPIRVDGFTPSMTQALRDLVKRKRGRRVFYLREFSEVFELVGIAAPPMMGTAPDIDNLLLLISDTAQPALFENQCEIFKDPTNPYYDPEAPKEVLEKESLQFICNGGVADDVVEYIARKRLLPHASIYTSQGRRVGKALVQDNIRFLLGFYRVRPAAVSLVDDHDY